MIEHPSIAVITGRRGSGKSALGYHLLDLLHEKSLETYVLGLPRDKWDLLPDYIKPVVDVEEIPEDSATFIDEASLHYHAYKWGTNEVLMMDSIISTSRQKSQTIFFATHSTRKFAIPILMDVDFLFFKEPSLIQSKFDRVEIRKLTEKAFSFFNTIKEDKRKFSYVFSDSYEGPYENPLPKYWCDSLSRAYQGYNPIEVKLTYGGRYVRVSSLEELSRLMGK